MLSFRYKRMKMGKVGPVVVITVCCILNDICIINPSHHLHVQKQPCPVVELDYSYSNLTLHSTRHLTCFHCKYQIRLSFLVATTSLILSNAVLHKIVKKKCEPMHLSYIMTIYQKVTKQAFFKRRLTSYYETTIVSNKHSFSSIVK